MPDPELPKILRLVTARSLNSFGRAVLGTTVQWELWQRTHSKPLLAALGVAQVLPVIALFVPAGSLVDRSDRRALAALAATATGMVGIGLSLLSASGAPPWLYVALLLAQGCATAIHAPAMSSLVPLIIAREELGRTNRYSASLQELSAIVGPFLAGVALTFLRPSYIYAALAVFGVSAGILYRTLPRPRQIVEPANNARKDWRVGLRFIFDSPLLLPALTLDMFAVLFAGVTALLPAVATDVLHVDGTGYGALRAAQSAGAILMAVIGGRIPPWKRPGRVLLIVVALFGAATVAFGLSRSFPLSLALLVLCGALDNISVVIRLTLEQMVVPDAIRGRVSAVHYVFIGMSNELGSAESWAAAAVLETVPAIVAGGLVSVLVVAVVAAKWRGLANMPPLAELQPAAETAQLPTESVGPAAPPA